MVNHPRLEQAIQQPAILGLPDRFTRPVSQAIDGLAQEPRRRGAVKPTGSDLWRIRVVGDYRAIYHIDDGQRLITVVRVGHRRQVYR